MSRRLRSVASRSQTMLMGPGQCRSAHDGELFGRARRNRRAFMEVEACGLAADFDDLQIGSAACRERVCQYVELSVAAVPLNKKYDKLIVSALLKRTNTIS